MATTESGELGAAQLGKRDLARAARRTKLLDAAEQRFAEAGYEGTVLRDVTSMAGTRLSSVTEDFGGKEQLFHQVLVRRALPLEQRRLECLELVSADGDERVRLLAIVSAYVDPMLERAEESDGWRYYFRFIAILANSRHSVQVSVASDYNRSARHFIDALREVYPAAADEAVHEGYLLMLASALQIFAGNARLDHLSDGRYNSKEFRRRCMALKRYIEGGLHAILAS